MSGAFFLFVRASAVAARVVLRRSASAPTGLVLFRIPPMTSSNEPEPPLPKLPWNNPSESNPALPIPSKENPGSRIRGGPSPSSWKFSTLSNMKGWINSSKDPLAMLL